jgi:hypothetical protein
MAEMETSDANKKQPQFLRRGEDFESLYANNVYFQPSEWDLKLTFGELDNDKDNNVFVNQHTSISIPWLQAKIMNYFLTLQLGVYEMGHGRIQIPPAVMPPEPEPPSGLLENDPAAKRIYEYVKKMRQELVDSIK